MTREEAITVLKGLSGNPLFGDQHIAAFKMAIHDIKQRHEWGINNLILINRDNYEPIDQEPILDKIRAEIAELSHYYPMGHDYQIAITRCLAVIDKYKAE